MVLRIPQACKRATNPAALTAKVDGGGNLEYVARSGHDAPGAALTGDHCLM